MTEEQVTLAISIGGGLLGVVLGFFLNLWNSIRIENKHGNTEKLRQHFDGLKQNIVYPLLTILNGVVVNYGTLEASTLRGNRTMDDPPFPLIFGFEEIDEYLAFQVHYPEIGKAWRELTAQIRKHNEDVSAALIEIEEYINKNPDLPPLKKDTPPNEVKVIPGTITLIYRTIYSLAQGQNPSSDFSKLHVGDYGNYQYISVNNEIVLITTKENAEKCKSALLELQNLDKFRKRALGIKGNACQLLMRLKTLAYNLDNIYNYGLISNKEGHKFTPTKDCIICKRIFY